MLSRTKYRNSLFASLWFGLWGIAIAGSVFALPSLNRGSGALFFYLVLPTFAATIAGALFGSRLLDGRTRTATGAVFEGLLIAVLTILIFAVLFAFSFWYTAPADRANLAGLLMGTLTVGFLSMAPLVLPAGALAGWLLFRFRR